MAAAIAVPTVVVSKNIGNFYEVIGTIAISASPATYTGGGIACNFFQDLVKAQSAPVLVVITGESGFIYAYVVGADASAGLLKVFVQDGVSGNPLAEIANSTTVPAGLSGDVISFRASWTGMW